MQSHRIRRSGFTLVEQLAVGGGVLLLGFVVLIAILRSREVEHRNLCKNNLKQIGMALHNYHSSFLVFPPGWIGCDLNPNRANVLGVTGWGWLSHLLPQLDESALYNEIDFLSSVSDKANRSIVSRSLSVLRCPSDPFTRRGWTIKGADGKAIAQVGTANYVGSFGTSDFGQCEKMQPGKRCVGDGVFSHNRALSMRDVRDGTANTLGVGERSTSERLDRMTTWSGVFPTAKSPFARILGTSDQALNAKELNVSGYGSAHQGISHVLIMDGAVRPLRTDIDLNVLQKLTMRADESNSEQSF